MVRPLLLDLRNKMPTGKHKCAAHCLSLRNQLLIFAQSSLMETLPPPKKSTLVRSVFAMHFCGENLQPVRTRCVILPVTHQIKLITDQMSDVRLQRTLGDTYAWLSLPLTCKALVRVRRAWVHACMCACAAEQVH